MKEISKILQAKTVERFELIMYIFQMISQLQFSLLIDSFFLGSSLTVYTRNEENNGILTTYTEAVLPRVKAEYLFEMIYDLKIRLDWDDSYQNATLFKKISENEDIVYKEMQMPFPLQNRDYVQWRYQLCNLQHPDLVKLFNLYDLKTRYYAITIKSIIEECVPKKESIVRADIKKYYWLIREDPNDKNSCKIKVISCQDLGGLIPRFILNRVSISYTKSLFQKFLASYYSNFC